jgi:hypothetical protein
MHRDRPIAGGGSPVDLGAHSGAVDQITGAVHCGSAVPGVENLGDGAIEHEADVVVQVQLTPPM